MLYNANLQEYIKDLENADTLGKVVSIINNIECYDIPLSHYDYCMDMWKNKFDSIKGFYEAFNDESIAW